MRRFDLGDPVPLRYEATDDDTGAPVAVTGSFLLTKPDGTTYDGVTQTGGTGIVDVTIPASQASIPGRYDYKWTITGGLEDEAYGFFYIAVAEDEVPPLGSFAMLARKLGGSPEDFDDAERARGEALLDEASELIRDVAGKTWLTANNSLDNVPRRIARICVAAAARAFENPHGLTQRSLGDSSKSYDRQGREGGEVVYLTAEEEVAIRRAAGTSGFVAVTLTSPYSADAADLDVWGQVLAE
jgi:hypothetical protein